MKLACEPNVLVLMVVRPFPPRPEEGTGEDRGHAHTSASLQETVRCRVWVAWREAWAHARGEAPLRRVCEPVNSGILMCLSPRQMPPQAGAMAGQARMQEAEEPREAVRSAGSREAGLARQCPCETLLKL